MKKIHIITVLFFSLFISETFANGFNKEKYISKEESGFIKAKPAIILAEPPITICEGSNLIVTANQTGGTVPFTYSWSGPNGFISLDENPTIINVSLSAAGTYTLTITDSIGTQFIQTTDVIVNAKIDPTFESILPAICKGGISPLLSNTSSEGVLGSWTPSSVSNTTTGAYIFTPNSGECANPITLTIFVVNNVIPTFSTSTSICQGDTPPVLPLVSNNGIMGTWSPTIVNNTTAGTYIFRPIAGQCASPKTLNITINPITIVFSPVAPICFGEIIAALPTTSSNGVTGNWTPAIDNTKTTTYTFTPTASQCTPNPVNLTIVVKPIIAVFNPVPPICSGNSLAALPLTSTNGVSGTWTPALDNTTTKTYTFTPDSGQCATTTTLNITVIPIETPTFNPIPDVCYGSAAPSLNSTSNNGYSGTWNPVTISNTISGTYTFTPSSGQCARTTTLNVIVTIITPSFTAINPICKNTTAPLLPTTSNNGIMGSWNPATVNNLATANYIFTPDPGQCAPTKTIMITVNPYLAASFNARGPICFGSISPVLQSISNNGYSGTWSPAKISNSDSETYTFTPNPGECTFVATLDVIVIPNINTTFAEIAPICSGSISPVLPTTSTNNIIGIWSPVTVSNTESKTYNFTPNYGQCGTPTSLSVTVYPSPVDIVLKTTDVVNEAPDGIIEIISVVSGQSPFQYKINNSSFTTDVLYSNLPNGDYTITVKDSNGCEFNKVVTINSICVFPNAISPNGDAFNESFNLKGCNVVKLEIFNRYGRKVNSYSDYSNQWDGKTSGGESLPDGTYFYTAEIKDGTSKSGWIYITK